MNLVTRAVVRRAAAVTAPTRASLADIGRHYPGPPNPALVPNGVDIEQFAGVTAADMAAARELYRLPGRYVLTVGAHRPHKNHQVLVRALAALPEPVSLVIVGYFDPAFPEPLPALIARLGLESRVLLLPEVADRWLPAIYRAASVFAFPSLAEGFGIPALEAMACGVPVVASDIPALAEVTRSAALLVDPRDVAAWTTAIGSVLTSRTLADRMSAAGTGVARAQTWSRGAAALHGLLRAVAMANHESYRVRSPVMGPLLGECGGVTQGS
jgi:glycosyltransferase involved in cell wall biosynthesis